MVNLGLPTWVKLTPNVTDITHRQSSRAGRSNGPCRDQYGEGDADLHRAPPAGARQPLRWPLGKCNLPGRGPMRLRTLRGRSIPVIGCGGISSANDVVEMMMAGATAVEIGSAVLDDAKSSDDCGSSMPTMEKTQQPSWGVPMCENPVTTASVTISERTGDPLREDLLL